MSSNNNKVERLCSQPTCNNVGVHLCSGCGEELYCSKECQKEHWKDHKIACKSAVKPETAAFQQSFDGLSIKQLKNLVKAKAATMETKKRSILLEQLDKVVERNNLLWLVKQHVQPSEIDVLLTNNPPSVQPSHIEVPAASSRGGGGPAMKRKLQPKKNDHSGYGGQQNQMPNPQQLKEQASMMRKNPQLVRQSNPMFLKMTNAQIMAYADYLDKAASDPSMMKELEKMSKLSNTERDQLQVLQEGLSGQKEMDDAWMTNAIKTLKTNPTLIKSMFKGKGDMLGGVSDSNIESFIDGASSMNAGTLKIIAKIMKYIGGLVKPVTEYYNKLNAWTFGQANMILITILLIFLVVGGMITYRVTVFMFTWMYRFFSKNVSSVSDITKMAMGNVGKDVTESVSSLTGTGTGTIATGTGAGIAAKIVNEISGKVVDKESVDAEFEF